MGGDTAASASMRGTGIMKGTHTMRGDVQWLVSVNFRRCVRRAKTGKGSTGVNRIHVRGAITFTYSNVYE